MWAPHKTHLFSCHFTNRVITNTCAQTWFHFWAKVHPIKTCTCRFVEDKYMHTDIYVHSHTHVCRHQYYIWDNWNFCIQWKALVLHWKPKLTWDPHPLLESHPDETQIILNQTTCYYPYSTNVLKVPDEITAPWCELGLRTRLCLEMQQIRQNRRKKPRQLELTSPHLSLPKRVLWNCISVKCWAPFRSN